MAKFVIANYTLLLFHLILDNSRKRAYVTCLAKRFPILKEHSKMSGKWMKMSAGKWIFSGNIDILCKNVISVKYKTIICLFSYFRPLLIFVPPPPHVVDGF